MENRLHGGGLTEWHLQVVADTISEFHRSDLIGGWRALDQSISWKMNEGFSAIKDPYKDLPAVNL